ncbi:hydroxyproline-rich glycoprotein family protein [Tasmannia lanceolata]|uniref:hydroxyproline-rich glycoprotein family protein n=1 Tax=Tasmannia lanceolata TaxID=3420 RepID=UPI0040630489
MEGEGEAPPFWAETTNFRRDRRSSSSSFLLKPCVLLVMGPIIVLLLFFLLTSLSSILGRIFTIFRPTQVKKSWDALNLLLVLVAILCGILSRNSSGSNRTTPPMEKNNSPRAIQQTPKWFDQYMENRRMYDPVESTSGPAVTRLSSSSSYPDLRQESWLSGNSGWRYSDDFDVSRRRRSSDPHHRRRRSYGEERDFSMRTQPFQVNTSSSRREIRSGSPPPPPASSAPPPPPLPPLPSLSEKNVKQKIESVPKKEEEEDDKKVPEINKNPAAPPPPPPLPPPSPLINRRSDQKSSRKIEGKKRSGGAKDLATTLASLYHHRNKKKHKNKTSNNSVESLFPPATSSSSSSHPPPPPPPPPPSVLYQLFSYKKGSKSKRIHSISPPPPPPPPPPPKKLPQPPLIRMAPALPPPRPLFPALLSNFLDGEEISSSGGQSPLNPIPRPPPRPPFRMQELKFPVHGDYVSIKSSLGDSPDSKFRESNDGQESNEEDLGNRSAVFCPSPDVNTKADTFIARLHAGWKLEKLNSLREKEAIPSPSPSPARNF